MSVKKEKFHKKIKNKIKEEKQKKASSFGGMKKDNGEIEAGQAVRETLSRFLDYQNPRKSCSVWELYTASNPHRFTPSSSLFSVFTFVFLSQTPKQPVSKVKNPFSSPLFFLCYSIICCCLYICMPIFILFFSYSIFPQLQKKSFDVRPFRRGQPHREALRVRRASQRLQGQVPGTPFLLFLSLFRF